jgi:hypothetical protein
MECKANMTPKLLEFVERLPNDEQFLAAAVPSVRGHKTQSIAESSNNMNKKVRGQEIYGEQSITGTI